MKLTCSVPTLFIAAILLFASGLSAQSKHFPLKMADGTIVKGSLLEDKGDFIRVKVGLKTESIPYAKLHKETLYQLRALKTPKDDGPAQFELAEYALKNKLFHAARQHFFNGLLADSSEAARKRAISGKKRADMGQCKHLYEVAVDAKKSGNRQLESLALSHLVTTFPSSPECAKAEKALAAIQVGGEAGDIINRLDKRLKKEVTEARVAFEKALEENQKGLEASRKKSKAERHFDKAVKLLKKCVKVIGQVKAKHPQDKEIQERVAEGEKKVTNLAIEVLVNLSHLYSSRQSLKKALDYANEAIALDPNSGLASQTRNHIELMMAYDNRGNRR